MPERQSLYHKFPDYRVDLEAEPQRIRVRVGDAILADTTGALVVRETKHDPVLYLPRQDVRLDLLERTDHHTFCPFKGEASYWTLRLGGETLENVVTLSTMRSSFARDYGVEIVDGPLAGLTARAVVVLDADNTVRYAELVSEIGQEPNYDAALAAL